jgi:hypothetical protein
MHDTSQCEDDTVRRPHGRGRPHGPEAARERADRTMRGLNELLDARPELQGVHPPADWAYDALRWSA